MYNGIFTSLICLRISLRLPPDFICWGLELAAIVTPGLSKQGEVRAKIFLAQEPASDTHWLLILKRFMIQWSQLYSSLLPRGGSPQEPLFPEPFPSACSHSWTGPATMSDHMGAVHLATTATPPPFFGQVCCCRCSALNWLPGWSEEPRRLLELSRVPQREVGGVGPSPFDSSDVLKLVGSSHVITSHEMERRARH